MIKKFCEYLEDGWTAVFAGAGLSVVAGYVDRKSLLREVVESLDVKITSETNLEDLI